MSPLDLADGLRLIHGVRVEGSFGHAEHLRFAWSLLGEADDVAEAERVANITIRHAAELSGNPGKYHYTMTVFWIRALAHHMATHPAISDLDALLAVVPELTDPNLPNLYWTDIDAPEARKRWVEPDLKPMP